MNTGPFGSPTSLVQGQVNRKQQTGKPFLFTSCIRSSGRNGQRVVLCQRAGPAVPKSRQRPGRAAEAVYRQERAARAVQGGSRAGQKPKLTGSTERLSLSASGSCWRNLRWSGAFTPCSHLGIHLSMCACLVTMRLRSLPPGRACPLPKVYVACCTVFCISKK